MVAHLKKENKLYEKLFEISDDGYLIVDQNGVITEINDTYCTYLGREKADTIGKHVYDVIPNSKLPTLMETGASEVGVLHKLVKDQTPSKEKYVVVSRAPVMYEGVVIGAVAQIKFSRNTVKLAGMLKEKDNELEYYKRELKRLHENQFTFESMIGQDKKYLSAQKTAKKASSNDLTVLITGETGTGKEVFASAIHYSSSRSKGPFIRVNCAAIPSELMESELFGYEEGAFTGARRGGRRGKFELADKGTIFLDEIGDMPLKMQAKLLRVIQEREVERVGGSAPIAIDVRIIAATNKNLTHEIEKQQFRMDLYYRLNVVQVTIPPLRERIKDVPVFIKRFVDQFNEEYHRNIAVHERALNMLSSYAWPGNVRELKNVINNSCHMLESDMIAPEDLPFYITKNVTVKAKGSASKKLEVMLGECEKEMISNELKSCEFNCSLAAKKLGIHRSTLYKKMEKYHINVQEKRN